MNDSYYLAVVTGHAEMRDDGTWELYLIQRLMDGTRQVDYHRFSIPEHPANEEEARAVLLHYFKGWEAHLRTIELNELSL